MNIKAGRNQIGMLIAINIFVLIMQLVLAAANHSWNIAELLKQMLYSLLYANIAAVPALLFLPALFEKLVLRGFPLFALYIFCSLFLVPAGCLAAQTLLWSTGALHLHQFWLYYFRTLPFVFSAALIVGLGAIVYGSMQERVFLAEKKLQEKAMMEERARKLAAEAHFRSLESRLHPHFLFNALNAISSLVVENPALAEKTVGRLAALLRASLDNTNESLIPLDQELAMIQDYAEIEKIRFGDMLRIRLDVPGGLRCARVPPLSVLTLVENAVKHGITSRRGGECRVVCSAQEDGKMLLVEVWDTGPGFDPAAIPAGHGLDNLVERLNALFGDKALLKVTRHGQWCVVQMRIPQP